MMIIVKKNRTGKAKISGAYCSKDESEGCRNPVKSSNGSAADADAGLAGAMGIDDCASITRGKMSNSNGA